MPADRRNWFTPPAAPGRLASEPKKPPPASSTPDYDPFRHALAVGLVKPKPSLSRVEAGNRWSRAMLRR